MSNKLITVNLSYYNQSKDILLKHIKYWNSYPKNILKKITFFIIDDCSKIHISKLITKKDIEDLDIVIYRVKKDLNCNIAGIRNLGANECKTPWYVIIDMDTLIPTLMIEQLVKLAEENMNNNITYRFCRKVVKNPNHKKHKKIHPAVCLIRIKDYWDIGGNEEDLVGNYGWTDMCFYEKAKKKVKLVLKEDIYLDYFEEGESPINRDNSINEKIYNERRVSKLWSTNYVRFPWEKVELPYRIAILYRGLMRGYALDFVFNNHKKMIYDILEKNNIQFDIYFVTNDKDFDKNVVKNIPNLKYFELIKSNDILNSNEYKKVKNNILFYTGEWQEKHQINASSYWYNNRILWNNVKEKYDKYLSIDIGHYFYQLDIELLKDNINYAPKYESWRGINNRLLIGNYNSTKLIFSTFDYILNSDNKIETYNPETFLKEFFSKNNIKCEKTDKILMERVRFNGKDARGNDLNLEKWINPY